MKKEELERYSRQILLYGRAGQESLLNSTALVLGAGGIGSALLPYLAASGVGKINVIEPDVVERSNLARQTLYHDTDTGKPKGEIAVARLAALNPGIEVTWQNSAFSDENAEELVSNCDIVLEGTDDLENKFLVSDVSVRLKTPALVGGLGTVQGHVFPILQSENAACYRCVFHEPPPAGTVPTCATAGILSSLPGVIGSMMSYLATLVMIEKQIPSNLYILDKANWRTIPLVRNPDCETCNNT